MEQDALEIAVKEIREQLDRQAADIRQLQETVIKLTDLSASLVLLVTALSRDKE